VSQKHLELFFNLSMDMLCVCDSKGYFVRVNPAFTRTLGHSEEYLLSKPYADFVHPDDREETAKVMEYIMQGGSATYFENRYLCKDGSYRWAAWSSSAAGAIGGLFYAVARDITIQKALTAARDELAGVREKLLKKLQDASIKIKTLEGLLPICSYCYQMRDEEGKWTPVEDFIEKRTTAEFTHGICPHCLEMNFPEKSAVTTH
jgi:PAS domain S-box-containing protein